MIDWAKMSKDERLAIIEPKWREGLSASEIAKLFSGCPSRNAVIGYVHRAGLTRNDPGAIRAAANRSRARQAWEARQDRKAAKRAKVVEQKARKLRTYVRPPRAKPELIVVGCGGVMEKAEGGPSRLVLRVDAFTPLPNTTPKPWLERAFGECAYPVSGEGADTLSCCEPCGDRTYCKAHRKVMFVPAKEPVRSFVKGVAKWAA